MAPELDPVFFNGASNSKMYLFMWGVENLMRGAGNNELYFNVAVADEKFQQIVENLGAKKTSREPEYRYKITL